MRPRRSIHSPRSTSSRHRAFNSARFGFWDLPEEVKKRYTGRLYDGMVELYRSFHEDWTTGKIDRSKVFIMRYDRMMQDFDGMMEELLPRHLEIIYHINHLHMELVKEKYGDDFEKMRQLSCIEEEGGKRINMAHLAIIGSHAVNGK